MRIARYEDGDTLIKTFESITLQVKKKKNFPERILSTSQNSYSYPIFQYQSIIKKIIKFESKIKIRRRRETITISLEKYNLKKNLRSKPEAILAYY